MLQPAAGLTDDARVSIILGLCAPCSSLHHNLYQEQVDSTFRNCQGWGGVSWLVLGSWDFPQSASSRGLSCYTWDSYPLLLLLAVTRKSLTFASVTQDPPTAATTQPVPAEHSCLSGSQMDKPGFGLFTSWMNQACGSTWRMCEAKCLRGSLEWCAVSSFSFGGGAAPSLANVCAACFQLLGEWVPVIRCRGNQV